MENKLKCLQHRIGRRGAYLLFLAILDFLYGYSLLIPGNPRVFHTDLFLSSTSWAVIWMVVGFICLTQAFVRVDRLGFAVAVPIKIVWSLVMLGSWLLTSTNPFGWITFIIFFGFGILTGIVSYWPEPRRFKIEDL